MGTGYQRGKIQAESMHYEMLKHTGEYPIVGVNTFPNPHRDPVADTLELARSTDGGKQSQLKRLAEFQARHAKESPAMLERLKDAVIANANVFEVLMDAVRCCLPRADHGCAVPGGRAVPAQHVKPRLRVIGPIADPRPWPCPAREPTPAAPRTEG